MTSRFLSVSIATGALVGSSVCSAGNSTNVVNAETPVDTSPIQDRALTAHDGYVVMGVGALDPAGDVQCSSLTVTGELEGQARRPNGSARGRGISPAVTCPCDRQDHRLRSGIQRAR